MRSNITAILVSIIMALSAGVGLSACAKKSRVQGSFKATECKTICNNNECKTRCLSADGSFK